MVGSRCCHNAMNIQKSTPKLVAAHLDWPEGALVVTLATARRNDRPPHMDDTVGSGVVPRRFDS